MPNKKKTAPDPLPLNHAQKALVCQLAIQALAYVARADVAGLYVYPIDERLGIAVNIAERIVRHVYRRELQKE